MSSEDYMCVMLEKITNAIGYQSHVIEMQNKQLEQIICELSNLNTIVKGFNREEKKYYE